VTALAEREADLRARIAALRARPDADHFGIRDNVIVLEDELAGVVDQRMAARAISGEPVGGQVDFQDLARIVHHVPRREVEYDVPDAVAGLHRVWMPAPSISVRRARVQRIRHVAGRARVQDDYELLLDGERVRGVWGTRREVMRIAHQALVLGVVPPQFLPDHLRLRGRSRRRALHELRRHRRWKTRFATFLRENDRRHKVIAHRTIFDDGSVGEFIRDAPGVRRSW
jgi:hypothetical protein